MPHPRPQPDRPACGTLDARQVMVDENRVMKARHPESSFEAEEGPARSVEYHLWLMHEQFCDVDDYLHRLQDRIEQLESRLDGLLTSGPGDRHGLGCTPWCTAQPRSAT